MHPRRLANTITSKWRRWTLVGVLVCLGWMLQGGDSPPRLEGAQQDDTEEFLLADHMSEIDRAMTFLKRQVAKADKNDSSLALVVGIQQHALATKGMVPTKTKDLHASKRKGFVINYRRKIIGLLDELLKLEKQLLDNRNQDAVKTYQRIRRLEKEGHKQFRKEDD